MNEEVKLTAAVCKIFSQLEPTEMIDFLRNNLFSEFWILIKNNHYILIVFYDANQLNFEDFANAFNQNHETKVKIEILEESKEVRLGWIKPSGNYIPPTKSTVVRLPNSVMSKFQSIVSRSRYNTIRGFIVFSEYFYGIAVGLDENIIDEIRDLEDLQEEFEVVGVKVFN